MANTYDLTQTGSEVQAILNDANNIKGAGAQTTLTTDYILLKDTNGQYHKILKDSFTEACRNVLAGLLLNNDKGTTISQIAAIASGDFGSVTPANLASVLGGMTFSMYPENVIGLKQGVYLAAGSSGGDVICQNLPSNAWFYLIVFNRHQDGTFAFAMQTNAATLYMATIDSNATSVSWTRIATQ